MRTRMEPLRLEQRRRASTPRKGMTREQQLTAYEQLVIPESKLMSRDALTKHGRIDFRRHHAPLLFLAGEHDHILPASLNHTNYRRYAKHPGSITDFMMLPGRTHFVLGQPSWRETAGYALDWIDRLAERAEPQRARHPAEVPIGGFQPAST